MVTDVAIVQPNDLADLAKFLEQTSIQPQSAIYWTHRFRWWWDDNPFFGETTPRGWLLRDGEGCIVGFLGNVPSLFRAEGRDVRAFGATTWRVRAEHRSHSIRLYVAALRAMAHDPDAIAFNTTANSTVIEALKYLHFVSLPSSATGRMYVQLLTGRRVAQAYLVQRKVPGAVGALAGMALRLGSAPSMLRLGAVRQAAKPVERVGPEFDELWERTKDRYAFTQVRSAAAVDWLCFTSREPRKVLIADSHGGALRGYGVFIDARWRGLQVLESVDVWTESEDERIAQRIIAGAVRHAHAAGYDLVAFHAYSNELARIFRKSGLFFTVPDARSHHFGRGDRPAPAMSHKNAYLSGVQGDWAV